MSGIRQRRGNAGSSPSSRQDAARYEGTADESLAKERARQEAGTGEPTIVEIVSEYFSKIATGLKEALARFFKKNQQIPSVPPNSGTVTALDILESKASTPFEAGNADHEEMLKNLWALLCPDMQFERISKQWSDIGFQGKDPATDFRGLGMLGLHNFLYLATKETESTRNMLNAAHGGFPLGIAVINISAFLKQLIQKHNGLIGNSLFRGVSSSVDVLKIYNELFVLIFISFEAHYDKSIREYIASGGNPAFTIMQFNPIREKFFTNLESKVGDGTFQQVFIDQARTRAEESGVSSPLIPV